MYEIKNGILYKDGKKTFVLGESYYPSFHPCKFPVPPEGDRMGEMKKDLKMMAELGFNHVRFAALGEAGLNENGELSVDTPFIDAMIREAEKNDISVSIRQQGFAVNLRGFENVSMIDQHGAKQETVWSDFIRTTLHHEGILEDNRIYAKGLARHYGQFDNVVGFQIYNEPHYPVANKMTYDYHPETIKAYRKWLVDQKVLTEEEAQNYEPPRGRKEQGPRMWALWRIFARDSITAFLKNASKASKEGSDQSTFTCFATDQVCSENAAMGCDVFGTAQTMDVVGYTTYRHGWGADYFAMGLYSDLAQCAAELEGKEAWCIELDSRTYIPLHVYTRNTYVILGTGCKAIIYYQWRGDAPVPGVPNPNSCGLLNYDGTKTHNFENGAKVNRMILKLNDLLMGARRSHDGIGLLHSDYALFQCDAIENEDRTRTDLHNSYLLEHTEIYRQLRAAGHNVSITDAAHLDENKFGIKVLYVSHIPMLSPEELKAVHRFIDRGGVVYENVYTSGNTRAIGFKIYEKCERIFNPFQPYHRVYDIAEIHGLLPKAVSLNPELGIQNLEGKDYSLIVLTNLSTVKKEICAKVQVRMSFTTAEFCDIDGEKPVVVNGNELTVEHISDGGILILHR